MEICLQYIANFLSTTILEQIFVKVGGVHGLKEEGLTIGGQESTISFDKLLLGHLLFDLVPFIQPGIILEPILLIEYCAILVFGKDTEEIAAAVEIIRFDSHCDVPIVTGIVSNICRFQAIILTVHSVHIVDGDPDFFQIGESFRFGREENTNLNLGGLVGLDRQSQIAFQIIAKTLTVKLNGRHGQVSEAGHVYTFNAIIPLGEIDIGIVVGDGLTKLSTAICLFLHLEEHGQFTLERVWEER